MSVAVYLRTKGLSASARSPVPALSIPDEDKNQRQPCTQGFPQHAPELEDVRMAELRIVEQITASLWEVLLL